MSHLIDTTTGRAAIFTVKEPAWHGLGTVVAEAQTSAQAILLAGMNWTVIQRPTKFEMDGIHYTIPNKKTNIRNDTMKPLSIVSDNYVPFQNVEAFEFFDSIVGSKEAVYHTAGCIKGGEQVWILAKLPRVLYASENDKSETYVLLSNGHDGKTSLRMLPTTVRVVCNNTLTMALGNRDKGISIMHMGNLQDNVDAAKNALGLINDQLDRYESCIQDLASVRPSDASLVSYVTGIVEEFSASKKGREKMAKRLIENLSHSTNLVDDMSGTAWAAYNAVSLFADHQKTFNGSDDTARQGSRFTSTLTGTSNRLKQTAFNRAMDLVS